LHKKTEQDEGLGKLEETVISTKHIALAVNEELTLHTRLLVGGVDLFPIYLIYILLAFSPSYNMLELIATLTQYSHLFFMQDDLDEHVDVTNSRLQVCFLVSIHSLQLIGMNSYFNRNKTMD